MRWLLPTVAILLLLPPAAAQDTANGTYPSGTGPFGPDESLEGAPGWSYGSFLLIGVLVFAGALAWAMMRQRQDPPSMP